MYKNFHEYKLYCNHVSPTKIFNFLKKFTKGVMGWNNFVTLVKVGKIKGMGMELEYCRPQTIINSIVN